MQNVQFPWKKCQVVRNLDSPKWEGHDALCDMWPIMSHMSPNLFVAKSEIQYKTHLLALAKSYCKI